MQPLPEPVLRPATCTAGKRCIFNPAAFKGRLDYRPRRRPCADNGGIWRCPRYLSNLRAPGYVDEDLGIQKWFNVPAKFRLQLTAQLFNAFNHANFTSPDIGIGDSAMGQCNGQTVAARQIQLSIKLVR